MTARRTVAMTRDGRPLRATEETTAAVLAIAAKRTVTKLPPGADSETLACERALLGGMLLEPCQAWPIIYASEFVLDRDQKIAQVVMDLTEVTDRPDLLLVTHELARRELLDEIGGPAYLAGLVEDAGIAYHLAAYAERVRRGARERARVAIATEILHAPEGSQHLEALLRSLEEQPGHSEPLSRAFSSLEAQGSQLIETGIPGIVLVPKTVTVLGGQTSHGKTAFILELSVRLAEEGHWVDVITLEDPTEAVAARLLARETGQSIYAIRYARALGKTNEDARARLEGLPLSITEVLGCREAAVIGAVAASKAKVVVVDYLQKIAFDDHGEEKRTYLIGDVMSRLSSIARRDDKAILATSQLSREMEKTKRPPTLADFADSSAIERQARQAWACYWPAKHSDKADPMDYQVRLLKVAEGPTYPVALRWSPKSGRFWLPREEPGEGNSGW